MLLMVRNDDDGDTTITTITSTSQPNTNSESARLRATEGGGDPQDPSLLRFCVVPVDPARPRMGAFFLCPAGAAHTRTPRGRAGEVAVNGLGLRSGGTKLSAENKEEKKHVAIPIPYEIYPQVDAM